MKVIVRSEISESQFDAPPKTPIRDIFKLMCKNLLIAEDWYFGLCYKGADNEIIWLDTSKKSLKDLKGTSEKLVFKVKYYPEDVADELIEKTTIELFFAQIRNAIYKDEIYCPPDTCALLASYALQAKHGDYDSTNNGKTSITNQKLIPDRVLKQYRMDASEWEESVISMWKKHKGMDDEDAMMEYLKLVQNLEMYGVSFFEITNKKGTPLLLGVNALGLDVYKPDDKLNPQISFPWSEIKNLKFKDRKFTIKPTAKTTQDFIFFTNNPRTSKHILNLGIGNHELYVRRRKPDTPEIVRMKERAIEMRKAKKEQRDKLNSERAAREEIERRENEYKALIKSMEEEMQRKQASLDEAEKTIKKLQKQLEELQSAKDELEKQQGELKEMMERLEQSKNMQIEEKQRLEEEIKLKQLEVQRIQEEVEAKDAETKRLQDAVEEARRREEELKQQQIAEAERLEEERRLKELEENHKKEQEKELESLPDGADTTALPELVKVNEQLKEQLKMLQEKLEVTKKDELETDLDKIHRINVKQGIDKYKTLADIRRGNTIRRVEMFENL